MEYGELLGWLLNHDSRKNLTLTLDDPVAIGGLPKVQCRELDHALRQAVHDGHAVGELKPYSGIWLWTGLRLMAKALRDLASGLQTAPNARGRGMSAAGAVCRSGCSPILPSEPPMTT